MDNIAVNVDLVAQSAMGKGYSVVVDRDGSGDISSNYDELNEDIVPTKILVSRVFNAIEGANASSGSPAATLKGRRSPPTPETLSISEESDDSKSMVSTNDAIPTSVSVSGVKRAMGVENADQITNWDGKRYFSDLIRDGLEYIEKGSGDDVVMIFECPSSSCTETSFHNGTRYKIHDFPPTPFQYKSVMRPLRYAAMNGNTYPAYLMDPAPEVILEHWERAIPNFVRPKFVHSISSTNKLNAYLPMESVPNHINDPDMHYHIAGKDAINLMTDKTTRLLPNTKDVRPCIAKVTHAMGSLGIFIIHNDEDEAAFFEFVENTGNPNYVVTDFVNIAKNLSCHYHMDPSGEIVWFGSSENLLLPDGRWSSDSTIEIAKQQEYQDLMAPYVRDVVRYCLANGFWGFSGIDVLFDHDGNGFVVDVNPRVTGTMPALMLAKHMHETYGLTIGKFRKSSKYAFAGSASELIQQVDEFNETHANEARITLFSIYETSPTMTQLNMAVYGKDHDQCQGILDSFSKRM